MRKTLHLHAKDGSASIVLEVSRAGPVRSSISRSSSARSSSGSSSSTSGASSAAGVCAAEAAAKGIGRHKIKISG